MADSRLTGKSELTTAHHTLGSLEFMRSNAYCSLDDIAKPFGKRISNRMRLKGTKELFEGFKKEPAYGGAEPVYTSMGGFKGLPSYMRQALFESGAADRGTWVHPDIAIQFDQWCSPAFALWVSRQIRHLMTYGEVNIHYREWTEDQRIEGRKFNRDDISDMYGKRK